MKTRKQRSAVRHSNWQEFYKRADTYKGRFIGRVDAKPALWLEHRNEISDKAKTVTIDHVYGEKGKRLMPATSRIIAIF